MGQNIPLQALELSPAPEAVEDEHYPSTSHNVESIQATEETLAHFNNEPGEMATSMDNPVETIPENEVSESPNENEISENVHANLSELSDTEDKLPEMSILTFLHKFLTLARKIPLHTKKLKGVQGVLKN